MITAKLDRQFLGGNLDAHPSNTRASMQNCADIIYKATSTPKHTQLISLAENTYRTTTETTPWITTHLPTFRSLKGAPLATLDL